MKITIEADAEGETAKREVFEHVTQFILAGSRLREKMFLGTFNYLHIGDANELIGMATALQEHVKDSKRGKADAGSVS